MIADLSARPTAQITADLVRRCLDHDATTGILRWRVANSNRAPAGKIAGSKIKSGGMAGRVAIGIFGKHYLVHRIIWLHFYGEWPRKNIDHIDGNPSNNRISNLRDVSQSVNMQNLKKANKSNKTGYLGVSRKRNLYRAEIMLDRKKFNIGTYKTPEEARAAYVSVKRRLHTGFVEK